MWGVAIFSKMISFGNFCTEDSVECKIREHISKLHTPKLDYLLIRVILLMVHLLDFFIRYLCIFFTGTQFTQLYKGGWGLCVSRERFTLLPSNARVPRALRHTFQPRGQVADQEHHISCSERFIVSSYQDGWWQRGISSKFSFRTGSSR